MKTGRWDPELAPLPPCSVVAMALGRHQSGLTVHLIHVLTQSTGSLGIPCAGDSQMIGSCSCRAASPKGWGNAGRVTVNKVRLQRADLSLNRHDALTKLRAISRFPDEETEAHRLCNSTRVTELGTSRAETCPGWIRGCSPVICARSFPAALLLALTMGLSSEALLIPQRPHGPRDQIPGSDTQVMPYSRSAPGKI